MSSRTRPSVNGDLLVRLLAAGGDLESALARLAPNRAAGDALRHLREGGPPRELARRCPELFDGPAGAVLQAGDAVGPAARAVLRARGGRSWALARVGLALLYPAALLLLLGFGPARGQLASSGANVVMRPPPMTPNLGQRERPLRPWRTGALALLGTGGALAAAFALAASRRVPPAVERAALRVPGLGPLLRDSTRMTLADTMAELTAAGVAPERAAAVAAEVAASPAARAEVAAVAAAHARGDEVGAALRGGGLFAGPIASAIRPEPEASARALEAVAGALRIRLEARVQMVRSVVYAAAVVAIALLVYHYVRGAA